MILIFWCPVLVFIQEFSVQIIAPVKEPWQYFLHDHFFQFSKYWSLQKLCVIKLGTIFRKWKKWMKFDINEILMETMFKTIHLSIKTKNMFKTSEWITHANLFFTENIWARHQNRKSEKCVTIFFFCIDTTRDRIPIPKNPCGCIEI